MQVSESVTFKRSTVKKDQDKDRVVLMCAVHDVELDDEYGCILCWHEEDEAIRRMLKSVGSGT